MLKIFLFCGFGVFCVVVLFLCVVNHPFGPFSFGEAKLGQLTQPGEPLVFKSNRFFSGVVFFFVNPRKTDMEMHVRIFREPDTSTIFNDTVAFRYEGNRNYLELYKANRISHYQKGSAPVQKIFDMLKYNEYERETSDVASFLLLLPNKNIANERLHVVVDFKEKDPACDFCVYAPYFLVY